ncbi:DNA (cytosine-5-)-methyltransferase [Bradyrhizobium sp. ORS 375]|uniref:DNA cytosine methyltransferase n=1 Tax=Bradyrhizobium sp. (strain ORS 375) TaxID=566679 RepID=UPI000552B1A3|nr:DNA (cytosine-5-)-methyltransferase [Bradyrhizobium sp. ORS 375]
MEACSLFSGIGGFEVGLAAAGVHTVLMCENDDLAQSILKLRFPTTRLTSDIRHLKALPSCDIVTAGWPCQDLSQAGRTAGIAGSRSGLVTEVFRLLERKRKPEFVLLENVAFALQLAGGAAIRLVTQEFNRLGYRWAYRVLDSRNFGLPQRRRRVFILASLSADPSAILFEGASFSPNVPDENADKFGFYWTEGNTGLGWSIDAVPPLKGGSSLSIPSPPAIWHMKSSKFTKPGIGDAERMQGFPLGWTDTKCGVASRKRWKLVGNAVSVPVVKWIADRLQVQFLDELSALDEFRVGSKRSHNAASGGPNRCETRYAFPSEGPSHGNIGRLSEFVSTDSEDLSMRAASGFLSRIERSNLKTHPAFIPQLRDYVIA